MEITLKLWFGIIIFFFF